MRQSAELYLFNSFRGNLRQFEVEDDFSAYRLRAMCYALYLTRAIMSEVETLQMAYV